MTEQERSDLITDAAGALRQILGPIWLEQRRAADALERIAAGVERIVADAYAAAEAEAAEAAGVVCAHPLEKRIALGASGSAGWQCACGHRELAAKGSN